MANLKEIRTRIAGVTSTKQITNAMKMVSAAKLKKAQDAIIQVRPYASKLHDVLVSLSEVIKNEDGNVYGEERDTERVLIVLITSNRGLCGAFNSNAIKKAIELAGNKYSTLLQAGNLDFFTIGKKGYEFTKKNRYNIYKKNIAIFDSLTYEKTVEIAEELMNLYVQKEYDAIEIVYNSFKNPAFQIVQTEQFLPIETKEKDESESQSNYIFEPSREYIVRELIPKSLKIQLFKTLCDSFAGEQGARMTSMHKATDNAAELIKELGLQYNKARQAAITNEILEIVGGAEALNE